MSFFDVPSGTTYYRSKDPLENFKIKVTLKKVALGSLWSAEAGFQDKSDKSGEESCVIGWQEKVFSKKEWERYSDEKNCRTVQEKAYHTRIVAAASSGPANSANQGRRIYSVIDADCGDGKQKEPLINNLNLPETEIAGHITPYRPRRPKVEDINILKRPNENLVGYVTPARRAGPLPFTRMDIMADLSAQSKTTLNSPDTEFVLCSIRFDSAGLIQMEPDFNSFKKPYLIQTGGKKSSEMYEYFLEHASQPITRVEIERENQLFRALYQRHQDYLGSLVGSQFKMPPRDVQWISLVGEIVDAEGFEYDDLFVHFLLDIPSGWRSKWDGSKEPTHLSTQITRRQSSGGWHFGCPFRWLLERPLDSENESWPQLLFEVISLDSWNRYRTEGYGFADIPVSAGQAITTIHTWRPEGQGIISQLRRFFIGGCPELDDLSYITVPSDFQGKELSRYGFRTTPSGKLRVRIQTVTQTSEASAMTSDYTRSRSKSSSAGPRYFGMDRGVEDVLEAFRKARTRLLEARGLTDAS